MVGIRSVAEIIEQEIPYYKKKGGPESAHKIVYDSSSETLEPIYFFILDLMNDQGMSTEKLVDNFTSSPGSGHFSELGQRATIMQQQGTTILGHVNTVLRSVLNLVYDLKEFKIRLQSYDDLKASDKNTKEAAMLSLKQIWMDKVDVAKGNAGNSSIKAMALGQAGFITLIDAFLAAQDVASADKLDLNDRVKRVVKSRIAEFNIWLVQSEKELRKRYQMERTYLKSQVNSLKLYSRWVKPYLKAAESLEQKEVGRNPALVKTFNTILLELNLFGKAEISMRDAVVAGMAPENFDKLNLKRKYYECILVDFAFRGIPQRAGQQAHYVFGGRAEVTFKAYALNEDELEKLDEELNKADIDDVLGLIEGATTESFEQLQEDINSFLNEDDEEEKKKNVPRADNPFMALLGKYDKKSDEKKSKKKAEKKGACEIRKESWAEKNIVRVFASTKASKRAFDLFDLYKKGHLMESYT